MGLKNQSIFRGEDFRHLFLLCWFLALATDGYCQEKVWTDWEDILVLEQSQLLEERPVVLVGEILFYQKKQPYFVIQTGSKGVPVFFQRSLDHILEGDRVKITGTTDYAFDLYGIRLAILEKLPPEIPQENTELNIASDLIPSSYFRLADIEGLVIGSESLEGGYILDFVSQQNETLCLYLQSKHFSPFQVETLIGCKVSVKGLFQPMKVDIKGDSLVSSIYLNRFEDLTVLSDLLNQSPIAASNISQIEELGLTPVSIEGKLERDASLWFLRQNGTRIQLDWHGEEDLEDSQVLCLGFPSKAIGEVILKHAIVFKSTQTNRTLDFEPSSIKRSNFVWQKSIKPQSVVLRSVQEIRDSGLKVDEPIRAVDLQAVVTYHDPLWGLLFVEDEYGGIYVDPDDTSLNRIPGGSVVRIRGTKQRGVTSNLITEADIEFLRSGEKVTPVKSSIEQMNTGSMDSNFITIEAIIQRAQKRDHALELKLISRDGKVKAYIRGYSGAEPFDHLIDSKVELTGTCGFEFSPDMEILGTLIYLNDQDQMKILQDGRTSFEQAPIDRLSKLDFSNSGEEVASRILLKGHYMGDANQNNFYFQTEYQGFIVHPVQTDASVEFGQEIEVLGWPRLQDYSFEIVDAVLRRHVAIAVLDNLAQSGMLLDSSNLNRFVRRSGFLTRFERHDERMTLHIDSSGQHLIANLEFHDNDMERDYEIPVGSEIEVSGILVSVPGKTSIGEIPAIKLRSFDSIKELAPPSFLTIQRIRWLVIVAGAIGVGSLLWGLTLKGQVRHQTAKIRKTVEMERQAKERFQRLFESALDMIFLCDTSARIISMNQAGLHLIGEDFSDVKGKSLLNWVLPADRNIAEEALGLGSKAGRKLASEGEVIELQLKISDGQSVYIELSIRGFLLRKGGVGYQCIARNVEARKQSEAHLIKARDAYREANKAKSVFLAMMSHELRTPMNGVIGMTQLLLKTSLNGEQEDQANTILASSRGMMRLILDLLDISRIESDKLILSEESFGLVELVEEVLATLSVEADRKQLDLTLLFQPRMNRQYRGDGTRLRQVLLNLVGNGIKFTERGGVAVKVMEGVASSKGEQIRIEVEDTGIGIGDGDKKDLFEAFIQLDSSDTRKFGGAGLGLTICKRIVQAMGGVIGVEAQSQRGSSFWVEIPFKVIDKRSVIRTPPIVIPADRPGILLVSNSSLVREYFRKRMNQSEQLLSIETSTDFLYRLSKSTLIKDQRKFYAVMIDFARTEKEFLKTLSKFADGFLGPEIKWVFIEPVSGQSDQARMMDHFSSKLKILKPLTETTFHHVCQFLNSTKSDRANVNESFNKNKLLTEGRDSKTIVSDARLKVLVAEDDPINQKLISLYLKKAGCHSILVPDGKQVLQKLNEGTFDVILMDCSMPVMDGFEASRQIRSKPKFKNLRIIALTAHSLKGDRERCFAAGMDDYLPKPLNLDLLTEKLSRLVISRA